MKNSQMKEVVNMNDQTSSEKTNKTAEIRSSHTRASSKSQGCFKYILVGDSASGKTSLVQRYHNDVYPEYFQSTIGVDFILRKEQSGVVQIWDTTGQERFRPITKSYYRNVTGVMYMFDITNETSFLNLQHWIQDTKSSSPDAVGVVVGCKSDLEKIRTVTKETAHAFADANGMKYFECSAKKNLNVAEPFECMLSLMEEKCRTPSTPSIANPSHPASRKEKLRSCTSQTCVIL